MTDTTTQAAPAPGTSTPTGAANVAEAHVLADKAAGAPAPAQAPAQAPAAAPAPADAAPVVIAEAGEDDKGKSVFQPTGHKNLDASLAFLGKHGFGPGHEAMAAAVVGDFSLLRAQIAEKGVAGGEAYIMLAEKAYEELHAQHEAARAKDKEALHAIVGGEEQWKTVSEWGKANASPEQSEVLNQLLSQGGAGMQIAASWLASNFAKASGAAETDGAGPAVADTRGAAVVTSDVLSPQEYGRATEAARRTHKGREPFEQSDAYRKLVERRSRWKA